MTNTLVPIGGYADRPQSQPPSHFAMRLTWKMAQRAGLCDHTTFVQGTTAAGEMIHENAGTGTPPSQWRMSAATVHELATPYNKAADDLMAQKLDKDVEPVLDQIDTRHEMALELVQAATADPGSYRFDETGDSYGDSEALTQYLADRQRIKIDQSAGKTYHDRSPAWVRVAGAIGPFAEAVGILALLQFWLNADLLRPWVNWLTWSFTVVIVLAGCAGQAYTSKKAGTAHNSARRLNEENNPHAAEPRKTERNRWLVFVTLSTTVIASVMVFRGLESLDQPTTAQTALLVGLSVLAAVVMPTLSYSAKAFDGSLYSRRADALHSQGTTAAKAQQADSEAAKALLVESAAEDERVTTSLLPAVVESARLEVHRTVAPWTFAHVQIGADVKAPALPDIQTSDLNGEKYTVPQIWSGIPGAPTVSLQPVAQRWNRVHNQRVRRAQVDAAIAQVPLRAFAQVK